MVAVWVGGAPAAPGDLCGAVGCGVALESVVDPCAAHSGDHHEFGDGETFVGRLAQRGPQRGFGITRSRCTSRSAQPRRASRCTWRRSRSRISWSVPSSRQAGN